MKSYYNPCLLMLVVLLVAGRQSVAQSEAVTPAHSVSIVKEIKPPILAIEGQLAFSEPSGNRAVDANENCFIVLNVKNTGIGDALGLKAKIRAEGDVAGQTFSVPEVPDIRVGETQTLSFGINAGMNTVDGSATFYVSLVEPNGFGTPEYPITVSVRAFERPMVEFVDYQIQGGATTLVRMNPYTLRVLVQNTGQGTAEQVSVNVNMPEGVFRLDDGSVAELDAIESGESRAVDFKFIINQVYASDELPIDIVVSERYGRFSKNGSAHLPVGSVQVSDVTVPQLVSSKPKNHVNPASLRSDVDKDIPRTSSSNGNTHIMIIANQEYKNEKEIPTARNDAQTMQQYCISTLGVPADQVEVLLNRTYGEMLDDIRKFVTTMEVNKGDHFMFFYFGHGMRDKDPKKEDAYLIPVDGSSMMLAKTGVSRNQMMKDFESANPDQLVVYLESCFSGGASGATAGQTDNLVYSEGSSGVRVADNVKTLFRGNIVLISASSGSEEANAYTSEGHNVFTYEFLKALKDSQGASKLGTLFDKVLKATKKTAWNVLKRNQNPSITTSTTLRDDDWRKWTLK